MTDSHAHADTARNNLGHAQSTEAYGMRVGVARASPTPRNRFLRNAARGVAGPTIWTPATSVPGVGAKSPRSEFQEWTRGTLWSAANESISDSFPLVPTRSGERSRAVVPVPPFRGTERLDWLWLFQMPTSAERLDVRPIEWLHDLPRSIGTACAAPPGKPDLPPGCDCMPR